MPQRRSRKKAKIEVSRDLAADIEAIAKTNGFSDAESYIGYLHRKYRHSKDTFSPPARCVVRPQVAYREQSGTIFKGDSLGLLTKALPANSVDLIVTSPPFGLVRQKDYGNIAADDYLAWFNDFGHGFRRVLKDTGSLVIDIGGAWVTGSPTKSLYQFKLLTMLCEEIGFKLAQDLYWWNPARMPSPAAWVTIDRSRLTDSVNCVWWLSKTGRPKADNRRVLNPYKSSQLANIAKKFLRPDESVYNEGLRPSGHKVSSQWAKDNNGAIAHNLIAISDLEAREIESVPSNLLALANTQSNDPYRRFCRDNGLKIHPAPFPAAFPAFFIRFLTDEGDLVLDPFAGSCVTGAVAKDLKRKWICCELEEDYIQGGVFRVRNGTSLHLSKTPKPYQVYPAGLYDPNASSDPLPVPIRRSERNLAAKAIPPDALIPKARNQAKS